ncbi:MAG: hypothetical protein ACK5SI_06400, partial [Planctomycetia bacterium]
MPVGNVAVWHGREAGRPVRLRWLCSLAVGLAAVPAAGQAPPGQAQAAGRGTSFTRQVAPILSRKCGGCHIAGNKGNFQMPSHAALLASGFVQRGN